MNNDISLSFTAIGQAISHFFRRYHVVLFVLFALGGLAVITFLLNNIIMTSTKITETPRVSGFDQSTINKIQQLKTSDESDKSATSLQMSRRNPFVE